MSRWLISFLIPVLFLASCRNHQETVLSGVVSKGPLDGATVCARSLTRGVAGDLLGTCTQSDAQGQYRLNLGDYAGEVLIEASGGRYSDEATGLASPLNVPLRTVAEAKAGESVEASVTALTEIALRIAEFQGGLERERVDAAMARVAREYGVTDIRGVRPADVLARPDAAEEGRAYGLALATLATYQREFDPLQDLGHVLSRAAGCLGDERQCRLWRVATQSSRRIFESRHAAIVPAGVPSACMIRAEGNAASACLVGLDPARQSCDAASLGSLVESVFVEYFEGGLGYTPALRCDADARVRWDVRATAIVSHVAHLYRDAQGWLLVDQGLGASVSVPTRTSRATANVDVYGVINIAITDTEQASSVVFIVDSPFAFRVTRMGGSLEQSATFIGAGIGCCRSESVAGEAGLF